MATGARRDDTALAEGLARWVAAHPGDVPGGSGADDPSPVAITGVVHADGGLANETLLVELGPGRDGMVVRLPPLDPTFPDYDLGPQAAVQNAAASAGVPAPAPAVVESDASWIGTPFLAMPRVRGDIAGPAPVFDPYVLEADPARQLLLHDGLIDSVAAIHAVPWEEAGLGRLLAGPGLRDLVDHWVAYVEWSSEGDPLPALAEALDWCGRHVPPERVAVLAVGRRAAGQPRLRRRRPRRRGARLGSRRRGPARDGSRLVLRARVHDGAALRPARAGFPSKTAALERYEARTGTATQDLPWHEVFALARALAINDRHQRITGDPRRRDNPMGAVLLGRLEAAAAGA